MDRSDDFLTPEVLEELRDTYSLIKDRLESAQQKSTASGKPLLINLSETHGSKSYITYTMTRRAAEELGISITDAVVEFDELCANSCKYDSAYEFSPKSLRKTFQEISETPQYRDMDSKSILAQLEGEKNISVHYGDERFFANSNLDEGFSDDKPHTDGASPSDVEARNSYIAYTIQDVSDKLQERGDSTEKTAVLNMGGSAHLYGLLKNYGLSDSFTVLSFSTSRTNIEAREESVVKLIKDDASYHLFDPLIYPSEGEDISYSEKIYRYPLDSENVTFIHFSFDGVSLTLPEAETIAELGRNNALPVYSDQAIQKTLIDLGFESDNTDYYETTQKMVTNFNEQAGSTEKLLTMLRELPDPPSNPAEQWQSDNHFAKTGKINPTQFYFMHAQVEAKEPEMNVKVVLTQ